jgi:hypothetical protein
LQALERPQECVRLLGRPAQLGQQLGYLLTTFEQAKQLLTALGADPLTAFGSGRWWGLAIVGLPRGCRQRFRLGWLGCGPAATRLSGRLFALIGWPALGPRRLIGAASRSIPSGFRSSARLLLAGVAGRPILSLRIALPGPTRLLPAGGCLAGL